MDHDEVKKNMNLSALIPSQIGFAQVRDASLYYELSGTGKPLVLIHGTFFDSRVWDMQMSFFAQYHRVLRYDIPPFGQSKEEQHQHSYVYYLAELLNTLHMQDVVLLGMLQGADIALEYVLKHPENTKALILVASHLHGYRPRGFSSQELSQKGVSFSLETVQQVTTAEQPLDIYHISRQLIEINLGMSSYAPTTNHPEALHLLRHILLDNAPSSIDSLQEITLSTRWFTNSTIDRLNEIHVPTLVLVGERMPAGAHDLADMLTTTIPHAKKRIVPQAPTIMNMDQPEIFNRTIIDFLQEIPLDS